VARWLELVDEVGAGEELVLCGPVVVAKFVPGVVEANLRPQHERAADVLGHVVIAGGGVVEAGDQRRGTIDGPGSDVVTGGLSLKSGLLAKQGKPEVPDDGGDDGYGHRMWRDDVMESRHKSLSFSSLSRELTHE
jgi:hypothetical protein